MQLSKMFRFEASHSLPKHGGKCRNLHGHSWVLRVQVSGPVDLQTGFVMDFFDLKSAVQPIIDRLDHHHLGSWDEWFKRGWSTPVDWQVPGMNTDMYPSSENLILWIADELEKAAPSLGWSSLTLEETCTSACVLPRNEYVPAEMRKFRPGQVIEVKEINAR